jgi:hypothetical protein
MISPSIKNNAIPIVVIVIVVLVRYYELFLGADIFLYWDQYVNSDWSHGNSLGNGWRAEKGFGTSFFFGDPGAMHPWSLISIWEGIASSRKFAYHTAVIVLGIISSIAVYFFLKRVVPGLGKAACFLSPLIILSSSQGGQIFNRLPIPAAVGVSLLLILLYDFYKRPILLHFFYAVLLFWYVIFLGTFQNFGVIVSIGFVFTIFYCIYYNDSWKNIFSKYLLIVFIGGFGTIILGFWEMYSIAIDFFSVEYLREKVYLRNWEILPNIKAIGQNLLSFFQFYSIPLNVHFLGLGWRPFYYSWNITPIFPLVFVFFLFHRSTDFWEYSLKRLLAVFYISGLLLPLFPVVSSTLSFIAVKSQTLIDFYGHSWSWFILPVQIGLIGVFLVKVKNNDCEIKNIWGKKIQVGIAYLLCIFYVGLMIFSLFSLFLPHVLPSMVSFILTRFSPEQIGRYPKDFFVFGAVSNIQALQNSMHWHSLVFYLLTATFMFSFIQNNRYFSFVRGRIVFVSGLILLAGILSSWTLFPLNNKPSVWEEIAHDLPEFKPTDRFYYAINPKQLSQQPLNSKNIEEIKQHLETAYGGASKLELRYAYQEAPGLRLHGWKPFTQKDQGEFIYHIFNGDGVERLHSLRSLARGPMISSELLDMGAVNYYYFNREPSSVPEHLYPYAKTKLVSIYKNLNAWPYYYLAEKLEIREEGKHLKNVQRGTAYLSENDFFKLYENAGNSSVQLKEFSSGRMVFDFQGDKEEFLVVADAWHPFWKATSGDQDLSVIKANEIFKGVKLPPGEYTFTLFFDTSPYFLGIYVSITAWILFLTALFLVLKYRLDISCFSKTKVYHNLQRLINE